MWRDRRLLDLFGLESPIIQAPMAGAQGSALAIAVSQAGGLGSLPCALLTPDQIRAEILKIRQQTDRPFNVNFFCHAPPAANPAREAGWIGRLAPLRKELGVDVVSIAGGRAPFSDDACALVEEFRPRVASFHFGLPRKDLLDRVKSAGVLVIASATTVAEATWLEDHGVDAVIAQGVEAGGHRGMFLGEDVASQPGTFSLVPQVADAVRVPVIAAGGIGDGRGIAAALMLGAAGVQIGSAYLLSPESTISAVHRLALKGARDDATAVTNIFTGRPARGLVNRAIRELGPLNPHAPAFPTAANAMLPLRAKAESTGSPDFTPLWCGQATRFAREMPASTLTRSLAQDALDRLRSVTN